MKSLFISLIMVFCPALSYAQYNWASYIPLNQNGSVMNTPMQSVNGFASYVPMNSNSVPTNIPIEDGINSEYLRQQQEHVETTAGYYYNPSTQGLKRIKIKVNASAMAGRNSVFIRGTYDDIYNHWSNCNTQASKVDKNFDGNYISDKFEWKVNIGGRTIYFNY